MDFVIENSFFNWFGVNLPLIRAVRDLTRCKEVDIVCSNPRDLFKKSVVIKKSSNELAYFKLSNTH